MNIKINKLAANSLREGTSAGQGQLFIDKDAELEGIGMGVLTDGTPYLNQRGLAALCGVHHSRIGEISKEWSDEVEKPRVKTIKSILSKITIPRPEAYIEVTHKGVVHYCYPSDVCLSILEYYAFDAGSNIQETARDNFRTLAGSKLNDLIYSQVGYDPTHANRFDKWHERISLNFQSAPKGYFHVFNEAHTIIYELIMAGAEIGDKFVVDISIGLHWSKFWEEQNLSEVHGYRNKYPHHYPDSHPQSKSNPQESWCYPLSALGDFREWLQSEYIEGGKFSGYLSSKVKKGELPPSFAQLAIAAVESKLLPSA
ncbi:hypothetical protein [Bartonella sp. LJL80]